jgi:hypothetical protein
MSFKSAKKLIGVLIGTSCVGCIGGLVFFESGSLESNYIALASVILLVLAISVAFKWGRCPWCGQLMIMGLYSKKVCPACKRDLETGKKKKGKGGKR